MPTKSILVNFSGYPSTIDSLMPDNGLANLAGSLLESGHETSIMDFCTVDIVRRLIPDDIGRQLSVVYEEFVASIRSGGQTKKETLGRLMQLNAALNEYERTVLGAIADEIVDNAIHIGADFIGFKLWTGDGFRGSVKIAERIREKLPRIKLFAGGPHVDWFMESILGYTDVFDALAYGEGEETIRLLADYTEGKCDLPDTPNLIYRRGGEISTTERKRISDLDSLPAPVYDERIYPAMKGDQKIKFVMIDESRGCPNNCYFCIHPWKSGAKWRRRDPVKTIDLIEKLGSQINTSAFRLAGSNTPPDLRREIALEIIRRGLKIGYAAFGHVRGSEEDDYELLRRSGCISLAFGVESGSQRILDHDINKKIQISQTISALGECKRAGIFAVASIIVPCPHDTPETLKETLELLVKTKPDSVTMQLPGLIPTSHWYKNAGDFGFEIDDDYMSRAMTYSIKLLLPPVLWEPLPYKINGRTHQQVVAIAQDMTVELEKHGILTGIGDFLLLIGKYLGFTAREVRDKNRRMFITGDYHEIQDTVRCFNEQVFRDEL